MAPPPLTVQYDGRSPQMRRNKSIRCPPPLRRQGLPQQLSCSLSTLDSPRTAFHHIVPPERRSPSHVISMKPNLIDRLRCSPTLRQPSSTELATWAGDATWAGEAQPVSAAHGDSNDSVRVRPRCASLSLVLRQVEGEVQVLIIKRAVSLRCDIRRVFRGLPLTPDVAACRCAEMHVADDNSISV